MNSDTSKSTAALPSTPSSQTNRTTSYSGHSGPRQNEVRHNGSRQSMLEHTNEGDIEMHDSSHAEQFNLVLAGDLMEAVKAYVTRTFDEEISLIQSLTPTGDAEGLCIALKTSAESGTSDRDFQRAERMEVYGTNVSSVRKPTRTSVVVGFVNRSNLQID